MKPIIQIFIAILILIACFKLGEIKGRWDIARQVKGVKGDIRSLIHDFGVIGK